MSKAHVWVGILASHGHLLLLRLGEGYESDLDSGGDASWPRNESRRRYCWKRASKTAKRRSRFPRIAPSSSCGRRRLSPCGIRKRSRGGFDLSFDCLVAEERAKMLIFLYASPIDGRPIAEWERSWQLCQLRDRDGILYVWASTAANIPALQTFSPYDSAEGRPDVANLRRLGPSVYSAEQSAKIREEMKKAGGKYKHWWQTQTWQRWNIASTLCSAEESNRGVGKWLRYTIPLPPALCVLTTWMTIWRSKSSITNRTRCRKATSGSAACLGTRNSGYGISSFEPAVLGDA